MGKSKKAAIYVCTGILICMMFTIFVRIGTRQILVKKLGMDNRFTQLVLFDNSKLQEGKNMDWESLYPFEDDINNSNIGEKKKKSVFSCAKKIQMLVDGITNAIDSYSSKLLPGYVAWVNYYGIYQQIINWEIEYVDTNSNIIFMNNGYLTYTEARVEKEDIEEMANSVSEFSQFLKEKEIDFYYINAGSKVNPEDKELSTEALLSEYTNENGDDLLRELDNRGVSTLDMRQKMKEDGLDWYASYYKTDHHWTTKTGLWCASKIAEMLNRKSGFQYNLALFDESAYEIITEEDFWFGGEARSISLQGCEKESFDIIYPKYETEFEINIPSRSYEKKGNYKEVMLNSKLLDEVKEYSDLDFLSKKDAYYGIAWNNDDLGTIRNISTSDNKDKKILIVQDSFGWYSASFLSCDTGAVDLIYTPGFTGSIREYVNQTKPDVVLMMLCEKSIGPTAYAPFFDLR
jgi:hypothetical protein